MFSNHPSCQAHAKHFSTCRILLSEVFPTPAPSYRKKLIEVALPLEAINVASAREKSIRHGHPSTLHLWWARRPLAACRAVLFASIVDDPSSRPEEFPTEAAQEQERQRLFRIIERLVLWENTNNQEVLNEARQEILKATDGHPPPVLDPFCGGGSIPLEAQRLGLEAHASDLNPVAVLITKALIEIPPKFAGMPPVNPEARKKMQKKIEGQDWPGASGLAEDVRYYGKWMRDEAEKRIGHLYPKAKLADGSEATVIAWLWARTVKCPNPACGVRMPLANSFELSKKRGNYAWIDPVVIYDPEGVRIRFDVKVGVGLPQEGTKQRGKSRCLICGTNITDDMLRNQAKQFGMGQQLMAIVAEGKQGRIYISPPLDYGGEINALEANWLNRPMPDNPRWFSPPGYGLSNYRDLFTARQLAALTTFSDLVAEARDRVLQDSVISGLSDNGVGIADEGYGAQAYADAVATYLAFLIDQLSNHQSNICGWNSVNAQMRTVFARQAIPMTWDYAESNPFCKSSGSFYNLYERLIKGFSALPANRVVSNGQSKQLDAASLNCEFNQIICTDPPYYDNIGYADLSDFFYVWLRRSMAKIYPILFSTLLVPKEQELIATPYRFGGNKERASRFFEEGLKKAFMHMYKVQHTSYPLTFFYAFKQSEDGNDGIGNESMVASTGWETMLESVLESGFVITGTWPMRTEKKGRIIGIGTNALASSIIVVCRPRPKDAPLSTRKEFIAILRKDLPNAIHQLQKENIAPVDLAQAAIGPGMAIFSYYSRVLEADGTPMRVRTALQLINQYLDEYLSEQEGEYDSDTRWALSWFEQYGMNEGPFGDAETLSTAKNTSVQGMVEAGILKAGAGRARLQRREEMDTSWDPATDRRLTVWEATQYLICALEAHGEAGAAELQQKLGSIAQNARDLAYRLYSICERKGWAQEAMAYNSLVIVWPRLSELGREKEAQRDLSSFR